MITSWADWARFETRGAKSPRFASLIASDSQVKDHSIRDALIEELSQLENADQVELLGGLIVEVIASVLKSDPSTIPLDCSINQLGVDSLMATEIQLLFDSKLGLTISILELIGEATVRSIATQSLKTLMGDPNRQLVPMVAS
jgi:acyl carrier protein